MQLQYLAWSRKDPYENLALERYLLNNTKDSCTLLLWQNDNTVVIGCNQNPWKECRTSLLQEEGVKLARRFSGGGAVYHDLGNLNFSFICPEEYYDQQRQFRVILQACKYAGIDATLSGRNDLQVGEKKFSGNAFFHQNGVSCHHGTLLISSNYEKLARYLTPSKAKLAGKGVDSVRSRVANLQSFATDLTIEVMTQHLLKAFGDIYSFPPTPLTLPQNAKAEIAKTSAFLQSTDWLYGKHAPASCTLESRFPWGGICVDLNINAGLITDAKVYTDSLDWRLAQIVEDAIKGCPFQKDSIVSALDGKVDDSILSDLKTIFEI